MSRALISVALETEEEHLHAIIAGWPATAESHQRTATKATESHTLGRHVSRRLTANPFSIWLPESSVWPASHSTWAQHGHPAPGHSDWGQRRITEHRFTAIRHVGTLYLTNKHTLRGLYCTPLVVWFFSPLHWWRMRAYSWRITDKHSLPSWVCPVSTDDRHFFPDFLFFIFSLYRRRLLPSHGWVIETSHRGEHQTAADCGTHGRPTRGDRARGRRAPHCCCPAGSAAKPPRSGHAALAENDCTRRRGELPANVWVHCGPGRLATGGIGTRAGAVVDRGTATGLLLDADGSGWLLWRASEGDPGPRGPLTNRCSTNVSRLGIQHPVASPCPSSRALPPLTSLAARRGSQRRPSRRARRRGSASPCPSSFASASGRHAEPAHHRRSGEGHRVGGGDPTSWGWGASAAISRRVNLERRKPEGISRPVGRSAVPGPQDEPMPTDPPRSPNRAWLAGCIVHHEPPLEAPWVEVKVNGRPYQALLDSGSAVSLVQPTVFPQGPPTLGASPFRLPQAPGPSRWGSWRICPFACSSGGTGRGLIACSPPPHSLSALPGTAEDRS